MNSGNSIVCTLFEGHYHYGLAALVNSLHQNGFTGDFYAGYKGQLPGWASGAKENESLKWQGAVTMEVNHNLCIHFLPVDSTMHLTNYKPAFMLALQMYVEKGLFYFDPDIVVKGNWNYFEEWIHYGIAVIQEIAMSSCSPDHPRRAGWKPVIKKSGRRIERSLYNYFNGGFCGVKKDDIDFLVAWQEIIETAIAHFNFDTHHFSKPFIQTGLFPAGDQDALNAASMCCEPPISDFGPEGMDFIHGGWLMSHATGNPKPWKINYLKKALSGNKISLAEKNYWAYVNKGIITHKNEEIKRKKLSIKAASLINRFYVRS